MLLTAATETRGKGNSGNSLLVTFYPTFIGLSGEGCVESVGAVGS